MSKLRTLRSQLASLRASRQWMRLGTGYAALGIAILWVLLALFAIDFGFHLSGFPLDTLPRVVLLAIAAAGLVWAAMTYMAPFLGHEETDIDMALLVERQHKIDSDLVAALQFESEEASEWGSRELEDAVVGYVAQFDSDLDVYKGMSREQFYRRSVILAATVVVVIGLVAFLPGHAHAFALRLALDDIHYPSNTLIEHVLVNGEETLSRKIQGTSPTDAGGVQGRSVVFAALVDGEIPSQGNLKFDTDGSGSRDLELKKIDRVEFSDVFNLLHAHVHPRAQDGQRELSELTPEERNTIAKSIATLSTFDIARVEQALQTADRFDPTLAEAWRQLNQLNDAWHGDDEAEGDEPSGQPTTQLFVAKLPRLLDPATYSIRLGDAWTDDASISMTALPVVETRFTETAPRYARQGEKDQAEPAALQRSVIEGSQLSLVINASKPLESATLRILNEEDAEADDLQFDLTKVDTSDASYYWTTPEGKQPPTELWRLDPTKTPLASIQGPFRFEIQVVDQDGLSLETPLRGAVRLRADRPPRISGALVHRAVLPTATPEVEIRVDDDYGIDAMRVHVTVRKGEESIDDGAEIPADEEATFHVTELYPLRGDMSPTVAAKREGEPVPYPLQGDSLPTAAAYKLDLSKLSLDRGDQVRIVLEAIDYRGEPGVSTLSEPILLDITDESGILAGISEGDRRSQEQIDDLIRRQLGIGEVD